MRKAKILNEEIADYFRERYAESCMTKRIIIVTLVFPIRIHNIG